MINRMAVGLGVGAAGGLAAYIARQTTTGALIADVRQDQFSLTDRKDDGVINLDRTLPDQELEFISGRRKRWVTDYSDRYAAADDGSGRLTAAEYDRFLTTFDHDRNGRLNSSETAALDARHPTKRLSAYDPLNRRN